MNHSYYSITLDVKAIQSQITLPVKQGDTTRGVYISFVDGGEAYIIEEDCFAVFKGEKSDGTEIGNYCTIEDNKIIYPFTLQTVSSPGVVACEVSLWNTKEELITSARFSIFVDSRILDSDKYTSTNEYTYLEHFLAKIQNAEEEFANLKLDFEAKANKLTEYKEDATDDNYYSAKAVNEMIMNIDDLLQDIKEELQGDIDEISDLVGGEGSGNEVETETTIAEGTYTFEVDTDTGLSFYMVNDNVPYFQEKFNENDTFNVAFNGESFNNLTIKEVEGMQYIGSSSIFGLNDDVEAPFLISTLNDRGGLIIYTTLPADTYTLSISRIVGGAE